MKTLRNAKGFTLIELIMVIVILGILAAVAIPKYVDMQTNARNATKLAITGALNSTESILYAQWVLNGSVVADTPTGNAVVAGTTVTGVDGWVLNGQNAKGNVGATPVNWTRASGGTNMPGLWTND